MNNSGIYEILNTMNGKRYIGSAIYIGRRKRQHWHCLRQLKHPNSHLQSAWNKYRESAFEFRALLICEPEQLLMYEQRAIDKIKPEYNKAKVAGSQFGLRHTVLAKAKMSKSRKGLPLTEAQLANLFNMAKFNTGRKRAPHEIVHLFGNTFGHAGLGTKKSYRRAA